MSRAKTAKPATKKPAPKKPAPKHRPETVAPPRHARDATLEVALASAPEDREAHRVYADWLQAQHDP
ncbi:MAG: hypothetical protein H0V17_19880, partial [Deltaproteobacteria bacterium]|nr:hypothetical protein [Deltaproteobacteria bacterium]